MYSGIGATHDLLQSNKNKLHFNTKGTNFKSCKMILHSSLIVKQHRVLSTWLQRCFKTNRNISNRNILCLIQSFTKCECLDGWGYYHFSQH